jgi:hypothetical protein
MIENLDIFFEDLAKCIKTKGNCGDVYANHPHVRISLRRAILVLMKSKMIDRNFYYTGSDHFFFIKAGAAPVGCAPPAEGPRGVCPATDPSLSLNGIPSEGLRTEEATG